MNRKFESYRLSRRAEGDLAEIYDYTAEHWSVDQADRYPSHLDGRDKASETIALAKSDKAARAFAESQDT